MKKELIKVGSHPFARAKSLGMIYAGTPEEPYWDEAACYQFSRDEIEEIELATADLHVMCMQAVEHIIKDNLFDRLKIPEAFVPYIQRTWEDGQSFVYGRFDLAFDGKNPPKMLEYNADTPTSLLEGSVIQYDWLLRMRKEGKIPEQADQFNSIHESLIRSWKKVGAELVTQGNKDKRVLFACFMDNSEDLQTTNYLADVAAEAGISATVGDMRDIGSDEEVFYDQNNHEASTIFKLYPWEMMVGDKYGRQVTNNLTRFIEPAWKMLLSNKAILPILWEMFPGHENLLPCAVTPEKIKGPYVKKPLLSREGANVSIVGTAHEESTGGEYGQEGYVYQAYFELPDFGGHYPIIGSWVSGSQPIYPNMPQHPRGGEACGMGIRESVKTRITDNNSRFVPHYFL